MSRAAGLRVGLFLALAAGNVAAALVDLTLRTTARRVTHSPAPAIRGGRQKVVDVLAQSIAETTKNAKLRDVEQLSVIASSVMALGVLPGEELKVMLTGVCEAMPADALKALLLAAGESLEPRQHKSILLYVAPTWTASMLAGNHTALNSTAVTAVNLTRRSRRDKRPPDEARHWWNGMGFDKFGRDVSQVAVRRLVPRRAAKSMINKWVRDTDAKALKRIVGNAVSRVDPGRLAAVAPRVLAAIVGAPPPGPGPATIMLAAKEQAVVARSNALGRGLSWLSLLSGAPRRTTAERIPNASSVNESDRQPPAGKLDVEAASWLAPRILLALGPRARRDALADGIRALSDRRARALLSTPSISAAVVEDAQERQSLQFALVEEPPPVSITPASTTSANQDTEAESTSTSLAWYSMENNFLFPRAERKLGPSANRRPPTQDDAMARSAVTEAVERLPPALVAAQLRSLVESLPATFVRDEAVALVEALPPKELVEAGTNLIDAAPELALRSLAAKLLDAAADEKGRRPNSAAALHSLARAAECCDVDILRSTGKALLRGAKPRRVADEAVRLLSKHEAPARVKRAIVDALITAENKSRRFANLREMFADASSLEDTSGPAPVTDHISRDIVESSSALASTRSSAARAKDAIASLRRILLEKREPVDDDGEDEENEYVAVSVARAAGEGSQSKVARVSPFGALLSWFHGQQPSGGGDLPLEALLISTLAELSPELVLEKALETLAALPPESYESLAKLVVNGLWERVVMSALPSGVSTSVQEIVAALGEKPRDATLAASYVASATGGVAGGAAAKSALGASAKLSASAKGAVALSSTAQVSTGAAFGAKLTALVSSVVSAKTLALASVTAYFARLLFTGENDATSSVDSEWADVVGEAGLAVCLLAFAALGVTLIEELAGGEVNRPHPGVVLPPKEQLINTLLGGSDARLRRILVNLARQPPKRDVALACRDALENSRKHNRDLSHSAGNQAALNDRARRGAAESRKRAAERLDATVSRSVIAEGSRVPLETPSTNLSRGDSQQDASCTEPDTRSVSPR